MQLENCEDGSPEPSGSAAYHDHTRHFGISLLNREDLKDLEASFFIGKPFFVVPLPSDCFRRETGLF